MTNPKPVLFDSDGCVTSCDALWWALTSPDVELIGIASEPGVVSARQGAQNFACVLAAAGRSDIPIAIGLEETLGRAPEVMSAAGVHGADGLGETTGGRAAPDVTGPEASAFIGETLRTRPGEITIAALGPFTNIGRLVRREPEVARFAAGLHVMGGVVRAAGNAMPMGEMNFVCDPDAGREMVLAAWSQPPVMVPLDVTHVATYTDEEFGVLNARRTPQAAFMAEPFAFYRQLGGLQVQSGVCPSHDTLAMMTVAHPDLVSTVELPVTVDCGGDAAWGTTVVDFRPTEIDRSQLPEALRTAADEVFFAGKGRWRVALGVDVDDFRRRVRDFYGKGVG